MAPRREGHRRDGGRVDPRVRDRGGRGADRGAGGLAFHCTLRRSVVVAVAIPLACILGTFAFRFPAIFFALPCRFAQVLLTLAAFFAKILLPFVLLLAQLLRALAVAFVLFFRRLAPLVIV